MPKLTLDLQGLRVDSFSTADAIVARDAFDATVTGCSTLCPTRWCDKA